MLGNFQTFVVLSSANFLAIIFQKILTGALFVLKGLDPYPDLGPKLFAKVYQLMTNVAASRQNVNKDCSIRYVFRIYLRRN